MARLKVEPQAEAEIAEALERYRKVSPGLARRFLGQLRSAFAAIEDRPTSFQRLQVATAHGLVVRQAWLRRFPYAVVFLHHRAWIRVLAVAHHARRQGYWAPRLPLLEDDDDQA